MNTEVLTIDQSRSFDEAAAKASLLLQDGQIVALPTETVYGLAADALNPGAVQSVYQTKQRPSTNPLIVHVASRRMRDECVREWSVNAEKFANAFWPGPLTLVLPKSDLIPMDVTAGLDSVAIRWPAHPFMQAVIRKLGRPIAAPSANLANQLSPTSAEHVSSQLKGQIPLIVDGGFSNVGIESTVLDLTGTFPVVLRPGIIHLESLRAVDPSTMNLEVSRENESGESQKPQASPGLHKKHYAPRAPLKCHSWKNPDEVRTVVHELGSTPEKTCILCHESIPSPDKFARISVIPHDPEAYARALYAELFVSDQEDPDLILVEAVPDLPAWQGIQDRLTRASSD